ncbi:MAG: Na(+)-translocating NADH-quinone reductase subunit F [Flavobacteriales bacterium]|nr:Na(+)-translocating NADH-quinone reductase subunit F [Flavobacteriales bacterium]
MELKRQELHQMGMNVVGKHLEENGFEFLAIKSELGNSPQFVCIKNEKQVFFVLVRTVTFPENPEKYDETWMQKMKKHALEKKARLLYAGVGISDANDMLAQPRKGQESFINYKGLVEIILST